jgi:hypothetical protein
VPFSAAHRRVLAGLAALFALAVGLRLHGFSTPAWHQVLDGSQPTEILLGEARLIRSDDWFVHIPLALAQAAHEPPFPARNRLIGLGSEMWVPLQVPVAGPLALLRPTLWGWFLGRDVGLAWAWWSAALGLYAALFLWLSLAAGGRALLPALGALALVFSPFFQFWSLSSAPLAAAAALAAVAACGVVAARRRAAILGFGLLLGWAGGCFLMTLYPPYQIALAWLAAPFVAAFAWERRATLREELPLRAAASGVALALLLCAALGLWVEAGEAIAAVQGSAYPGRRVESGGGFPLWRIFLSSFAPFAQVRDWGTLLNVCEASGFALFAPALGAALALRRRASVVELALLAWLAAAALWATLGLPEAIARATGLSSLPPRRIVIGLGIADALLLLRFLSRPFAERAVPARAAAAIGAAFALALCALAVPLHRALPDTHPFALATAAVASGALAALFVGAARPWLPLAVLAAASVALTVSFNPLVRGGSGYLLENPLARRVLAVDAAAGGDTLWLAVGSRRPANWLRTLGLRTLNGTHPIPQRELWERLDPEGRYRSVWNRYATVTVLPSSSAQALFELESVDGFLVHIRPDAPVLRELGVTHVLAETRDPGALDALPGLRRLETVGRFVLYALDAAPASEVGGPFSSTTLPSGSRTYIDGPMPRAP